MNKCAMGEQQCLSLDRSVGKCKDWKQMSVLVADLVGRSVVHEKVETKSNIMTLLIRAASGVIGRGADTLKTLIVNGLVLLTQTVSFGKWKYEQNLEVTQILLCFSGFNCF